MKKSSVVLLCSSGVVLIGAIILGSLLFWTHIHPTPHIQCEAMRPLISFNGVDYSEPTQAESAHPLSANQLGPVVGTAGDGPQNVRYDCGLLDPGEQVYSIRGYSPAFRLAVHTTNGVFFFEAGHNSQAKTGSDLFASLNGKVQFITLAPIDNPGSSTRTIRNPAQVQKLVNVLLASPVSAQCSFTGNEEAMLFHLQDGSVVQMSYWSTVSTLSTSWPQCFQPSQNFASLLTTSN